MSAHPKAVILVGGQGTRLQPLTYYVPKPMVPVLLRPFMEHTIAYLKKHGIESIVLALSYLPDVIQGYFGDGSSLGVNIDYSIEVEPLGTAGAVKNAERHLNSTFIVLNGDIFSGIDIADLYACHRRNRAKATIALTWVENPSAFGVVETQPDGRVSRFIEKPPPGTETTNWINAGVYVLEPEVMRLVPPDRFHMFERGLFPQLLQLGEPVYGYPFEGYWLDMGTVGKYLRLNCDLLLGTAQSALVPGLSRGEVCCLDAEVHPSAELTGPAIIGAGAKIARGAAVTGPAVIGEGCIVDEGASISRAVLWGETRIGAGSRVKDCVIGGRIAVEAGTEVAGRVLTPDHGSSEIASG